MVLLDHVIRIRLKHDILTSIDVMQGDTSREFHFIFDDYIISDNLDDIRVYVKKPSGYAIYNYGYLNEKKEVVFQPTYQTLAEAGTCIGLIQLISNASILTSFNFRINVSENMISNSGITSKDEFLILDELIKTARLQTDELDQLIQNVTEQEEQRVTAENIRIQSENNRVSAELSRVQEENKRNSEETIRQENELQRKESETNRENAESIRKLNEESRQQSETNRQSEEDQRIENEDARKTAEQERINAENERIANENERVDAENSRASNETQRNQSENERKNAENSRISAENSRATQFTTILSEMNQTISACETATDNANNATDLVNAKLDEFQSTINNFIDDDNLSDMKTFSSNKLVSLLNSMIISSINEPEEQLINSLWFKLDDAND